MHLFFNKIWHHSGSFDRLFISCRIVDEHRVGRLRRLRDHRVQRVTLQRRNKVYSCFNVIINVRVVITNVRVVILNVTVVFLNVTVVILGGTLVIYNELLVIITLES